jgi:hypothetical protein
VHVFSREPGPALEARGERPSLAQLIASRPRGWTSTPRACVRVCRSRGTLERSPFIQRAAPGRSTPQGDGTQRSLTSEVRGGSTRTRQAPRGAEVRASSRTESSTRSSPVRRQDRARSQLTAPAGRGNSCCTTTRRSTTPRPLPHRPRAEAQHPRPDRHRDCSSASANPPPAGSTGPSSGASTNAHRAKCTRIASAPAANRRSQPRTVSFGTPSRAAIRRCPTPVAFASTAAPITDTSSRRRDNATSRRSTCVPAHPRHLARRGTSTTVREAHRNTRSRA